MSSHAHELLTRSVVLPSDASAARQGRELARSVCRTAGLSDQVRDTAILLTSETVTNAVLHGRSQPVLTITVEGPGLRISVGDDNSRTPLIHRDLDLGALNGRGIQLLDSCASDWGVDPDGHGGKVVWFTCY